MNLKNITTKLESMEIINLKNVQIADEVKLVKKLGNIDLVQKITF